MKIFVLFFRAEVERIQKNTPNPYFIQYIENFNLRKYLSIVSTNLKDDNPILNNNIDYEVIKEENENLEENESKERNKDW